VLVYELYEGFGLKAAEPVALLLILVALVAFILLRLALLPENE
jgi:ABC-type sulfate transport system permease component